MQAIKTTQPRRRLLVATALPVPPLLLLLLLLIATGERARAHTAQPEHTDLADPTGFFANDSLHGAYDGRLEVERYIHYALRSVALVAGYDNDLHRYDRRSDKERSYERRRTRAANELEACEQQVAALGASARLLLKNDTSFLSSKELSLINFIDSFGAAPASQLLMGNTIWLGSYEQCTNARVTIHSTGVQVSPRYCVASFKSPNWKASKTELADALALNDTSFERLGSQRIKLGVCLPRECNSQSTTLLKNHIESFIKLVRLNQVPFSSFSMTNLYCLPDEGAPLRQLSASALAFIVAISAWALLVCYFTLAHELRRAAAHLLSAGNEHKSPPTCKLEQVFAFRLCWRALFGPVHTEPLGAPPTGLQAANLRLVAASTLATPLTLATGDAAKPTTDCVVQSREGTPILIGGPPKSALPTDAAQEEEEQEQEQEQQEQQVAEDAAAPKALNLNVVDGLKVLSMIWLISGHTMLFLMRTIANARDFWSILLDGRFITVMAGIFPVDSFFVITGVLTAYLKFNKKRGAAMHSVRHWVDAFVHRYLRFMPMYVIIFWYTRDVSEYIGSGPLWDYATADTSLRSMCKRESFLVPLLFQANQKPIEQHCVKPAWYLANDYQYLLVTPVFMALIIKSSLLGYTAIALSVASSLAAQFFTVYYARDFTDFESLINFKPMFVTYVLKNLWRLYVMPYNRIAPYLIGILTGHLVYSAKRRDTDQRKSRPDNNSSSNELLVQMGRLSTDDGPLTSHKSPGATHGPTGRANQLSQSEPKFAEQNPYKGSLKLTLPLIMLISIVYLPKSTRYFTYTGPSARVGASLLIALVRLFWSIAIARLIYVCVVHQTTGGFVCRFLSSAKWRPWSKIGLSVLLIQWEIIGYYAQTQTYVPQMTISYLISAILICSVGTYAIGLLIYLTIEYPLSQLEHLYIHPKLFPKK